MISIIEIVLMTMTKTCTVTQFLILYTFSIREIQVKGKTLKSMGGNGIVFYGVCKKILKFFSTPMYFDRG